MISGTNARNRFQIRKPYWPRPVKAIRPASSAQHHRVARARRIGSGLLVIGVTGAEGGGTDRQT